MTSLLDVVVKRVGQLCAISLVLLVLLVFYDALSRYLFQSGSIALQELEWHLFDIVILLSIAYALQTDSHVRVDIFYEHFSDKTKSIVNIFSNIFFIFPVSILIIYVGISFVEVSFSQLEGSSNPGGLPYRFLVKSLMPLAFLTLLLQSISQILKELKQLRSYR